MTVVSPPEPVMTVEAFRLTPDALPLLATAVQLLLELTELEEDVVVLEVLAELEDELPLA